MPHSAVFATRFQLPLRCHRGGLVDVADPRITGALEQPFDPLSLAAAIHWALKDSQRRRQLGVAARQRAERLWEPARVAGLYSEVYLEVFGQAMERGSQFDG